MSIIATIATIAGTAPHRRRPGPGHPAGCGHRGRHRHRRRVRQRVRGRGHHRPSTAEAVGTALDVCPVLDEGGDLADAVFAVADDTELTVEDSAFFVGASVAAHCPEYD